MNTVSYFEIQSSDPQRDSRFYQSVFDWKFILQTNIPIEYYRIETNGISGGLLKRPVKVPPMEYGTNAFTCSIEVENFDSTSQHILQNGGQVAMAKFAIAGRCWQGYFIDPDKNVFGIFQVDENAKYRAVYNFYDCLTSPNPLQRRGLRTNIPKRLRFSYAVQCSN